MPDPDRAPAPLPAASAPGTAKIRPRVSMQRRWALTSGAGILALGAVFGGASSSGTTAELRESVASLEASESRLEDRLAKAEDAAQQHLDDSAALDTQLDASLAHAEELTTQITGLTETVAERDARIAELESALASAQAQAPRGIAGSPPAASPPAASPPSSVYYKNCTAARNAGAAPVRRGEPGYGSHLDRDNDGIGCE